MTLNIHAISDIGCVRTNNEDMILIGNELLRDKTNDYEFDFDSSEYPFMIAVADGMGGQKGGEYASEIVLNEMNKAIHSLPIDMTLSELKGTLKNNILTIHKQLIDAGLKDPEKAGMGSTFIGVLFFQNSLFMINVGDSRLYRFRDGILSQLSRDHSLSEMTNNPDAPKNIIVNSFGAGEKIFFDFEDISSRLLDNDILLLCSDGLTGELTDEEIESILSQTNSLENLLSQAKEHGGRDNTSIILCRIN
jgi:PPM family protein phosphatase